jgi:hypothetical protein
VAGDGDLSFEWVVGDSGLKTGVDVMRVNFNSKAAVSNSYIN